MPASETAFLTLVALASVAAGAIASVSGFGIGSLLTPVLGWRVGTKLAVAAVSVPHFVATALRFVMLREHVDRNLLLSFGVMSAAGGLAGALLHSWAENRALTVVFGALLVFTGVSGLTGLSRKMRFHGPLAWLAGAVSGFLGGLVGNQGGIRSAAMMGFNVERHAFVATATAVGIVVDSARMPVYLATQGSDLVRLWLPLLVSTAGCVVGTLAGAKVLKRLPEPVYRRIVSGLILALGVFMIGKALLQRA
ncbi:MAG: sulfite exporter TauE/SafE family protein [Planctomycetes bacterium]|nr:sulfite exporter TauE/SafE family protein [Planctomycetota bacterium]